jgi:predicted nuclease of predicted toxin-antitoxin system
VKLLLDENLSDRIVPQILDIFPDSAHVKTLGLLRTDDSIIWSFAKEHGFTIVSKDSDFHQRSFMFGAPPKFIFLRVGNFPTSRITGLLRSECILISAFINDPSASILVLTGTTAV